MANTQAHVRKAAHLAMADAEVRTRIAPRRRRIAYFDNIKFVLIVCVVLGHLLKLCGFRKRRRAKAAFLLIYSCHMPLFIFLSGLFLDRRRMTRASTMERVAWFALLGFVAKLLRAVSPWLVGYRFDFSLLSESGLPWFMFALAAYHLAAWLLRDVDYAKVAVVSLVLALLAGYVPFVGDLLCLSRIIVFFPFFWLGHMLSPRSVRLVMRLRTSRAIGAVILVVAALVCFCWSKALFPYRQLFMGRLPYVRVPIDGCSALHRLLAYCCSIVMGCAVLAVVPQRQLPVISRCGTRTLQVYLLHYELLDVLRRYHLIRLLGSNRKWGWAVLAMLAILIVIVLSLPNFERLLAGRGGVGPSHRTGKRRDEGARDGHLMAAVCKTGPHLTRVLPS